VATLRHALFGIERGPRTRNLHWDF
jgi:hypothetical protein